MLINNYNHEDYLSPGRNNRKVSDKLKLGHLVFNKKEEKIVSVTFKVLSEILENEDKNNNQNYFLILLQENWLTEVFNFRKYHLNAQYMTVFTSNSHGLKIHCVRNEFTLGYNFKEKRDSPQLSGTINYKPRIFFVHELMDYLFLIKKEHFNFNGDNLEIVNDLIGNSIKILQ